ncbi:SMI1/KNR4 family protein [Cytophagaceae bacterium DM2B3-1]|uniref:SMI1/KNR4 family protein n=1 Tax=Xanthocytophaga flava TaxID=3048013 RepID=A0ABT7CLD4_9BACT|nr:SMI1/KNR4 family protein [Xanthocytophaga flavus]MDJ1494554.1 SMI1/KNR4 family protein [Xanthocytophaga flavus]
MFTDDFWIQPAEGFNDRSRGRTEEEIAQIESTIGFRFPDLYRNLMKLQNGGYLRKCAYPYEEGVRELFYNGAELNPIFDGSVESVFQGLSEFMDEEEIEELSQGEFNFMDRLIIVSNMYGHSYMCFDYGWQEEAIRSEPQVCFFDLEGENGFEEYLRVESFEKLVSKLVYYGYESTSFYVGIKSSLGIEEFVALLGQQWSIDFKTDTTNRYGWFNFDKWFSGDLPIASDLSVQIIVSPNQHRSGTYLFQNHTDNSFVIELTFIQNEEAVVDVTNKHISVINNLILKLDEKQTTASLLLAPFTKL